jgi:hypothetical protein
VAGRGGAAPDFGDGGSPHLGRGGWQTDMMPRKDDGERSRSTLPPEESWFLGRRWLGVCAALVAAGNAVLVVADLVSGDVVTTADCLFAVMRGVLVITFTFQALYELRSRITVDRDGLHRQHPRGTSTYGWEEIAEVRRSGGKWGDDPFVELVRHDGEAVPLFRSAGRLDVLQRWHAAASGRMQT